jgi:hypothetical protein
MLFKEITALPFFLNQLKKRKKIVQTNLNQNRAINQQKNETKNASDV